MLSLRALLLLPLLTGATPLEPRAPVVTCNIDANSYNSADASRACAAIPAQITVTGTSTLLASYTSTGNPTVKVVLTQQNTNWSKYP